MGSEQAERNNIENENELETREEYMQKLQKWLNDARAWHSYCSAAQAAVIGSLPRYPDTSMPDEPDEFLLEQLRIADQRRPLRDILFRPNRPQQLLENLRLHRGTAPDRLHEFVIPPIWKRLAAELVDFFILFIIKMALTFVLLEGFNLINFEHYGLENFQKDIQNPKIAMQISIELLTIELIHRAVACAYEAFFLKGGSCATPGKRYMGLIVVSVGTIVPVPNRPKETVSLADCGPMGLKRSVLRAVMKNLFIGLMLPVCFALYFFKYNRTGYDALSNSLVVETKPHVPFQHG